MADKNFIFTGLMMRRGSGEVDRRRASLGAGIPGSLRPGDSIFDPNHAAILFRDSRGVIRFILLWKFRRWKSKYKM